MGISVASNRHHRLFGAVLSAAMMVSVATISQAKEIELEKEDLTFGFIKLTDMAPLAIAYEKGYFEDEGLFVTLEAQANWKVLLDRVIDGELDGAHMLGTFGFALQHQVGETDGNQRAVDWTPPAVFLEQRKKAFPRRAVDLDLAVLCDIASRRIQKHGFFGEPPVTVTCTTDTPQRLLAETFGQRELQSGVDKRGSLATAGRTGQQQVFWR